MDHGQLQETIRVTWEQQVLPSLTELITIPAVSAAYEPAWRGHSHLRRAIGSPTARSEGSCAVTAARYAVPPRRLDRRLPHLSPRHTHGDTNLTKPY
jgi:hypothetical protein